MCVLFIFFIFLVLLYFFFQRHICVSAHLSALSDKIILSTLTTEMEGSGGDGGRERETGREREGKRESKRRD